MSLANYKLNGVGFINRDTATKKYYGNVATGYSIAGIDIGETMNLQSFSMVAGSITASGYTTKIIEKYNTGDSWTSANQTARAYQNVAMSASGQYAIVGVNASDGKMYYSDDYGITWTASTMPTTGGTGYFYQSRMSPSGQFAVTCAMAGAGRSYYSSDYGKTWSQTSSSESTSVYKFAVALSETGQYQLVADYQDSNYNGGMYYSSNYGSTWTLSNAGGKQWRQAAMSASGQYAIACSTGTSLTYSMDYGQTWIASASSVLTCVSIAMSASGQYALASAGDYAATGQIYYSKDYGITWTASAPKNARWQSVAISATGQYGLACIVTASEKVYYSSDYGVSWTAMSFATTGAWFGVAISGSGKYALGCMGNQIYYSANTLTTTVTKDLADVFEPLYKYKTWTNISGATTTWSGVSCSNDGKYVVAYTSSSPGKIYYSSNYGTSFTDSAASITAITGISMSNTGKYAHACGYSNTSYTYTSSTFGAANWSAIATGNYFLSIATSSNGLNFIASHDGGPGALSTGYMYYRWNLGGVALCSGTNPPCNFVALSGNGKYGIACPNTNATVSGIYWSTNKGETWTQYGSLKTIRFGGCAISADGQYAIAGAASSGKIYYSNDFGVTWTASNSETGNWQFEASMSDSGQYCIFAVGNANIYYSNDYGVNWSTETATLATGHQTRKMAISKNGQYAFVTTSSGTIFRCVATNV